MKLKAIPQKDLIEPKTAICKVYADYYFVLNRDNNFLFDEITGTLLCNPSINVLGKFIDDNKLKDVYISKFPVVYFEIKAGTVIIGQ